MPASNVFFSNFTANASPALSDYAVGYNTATSGGEKRWLLSSLRTLFQSNLGTAAFTNASGANPSASAGLSAINGSSTNFMRSDGAPAISQGITPTWTNVHTFSPVLAANTSGNAITLINNVAATVGSPSRSPAIHLVGQGWKTNAPAGNQQTEWFAELIPNDAATNPENRLVLSEITNGAALTQRFVFEASGVNNETTGFRIDSSGGGVSRIRFRHDGIDNWQFYTKATSDWEIFNLPLNQAALTCNIANNAITIPGAVKISNTTPSANSVSGALVVLGGVGVGGSIYCANVAGGDWKANAIADAYIANASAWNAKESALSFSTGLTRAANTITVNAVQLQITGVGTLTAGTWNANTIGIAFGGTNLTSYVQGDLLYASAANVLSRLAAVATGNVLISQGVGTAPSWSNVINVATVNATANVLAANLYAHSYEVTNEIPLLAKNATYTTVLSDAGRCIYHTNSNATAYTWTIASNANVAYRVGTAITFVNDASAANVTIAIAGGDTLMLAGAGTTGSRTLQANGIATAYKVRSTAWLINGTNLA